MLSVCCSLALLVVCYNHEDVTCFVCVFVDSCERSVGFLIPHYLSSYIPLCIVMIVNPILYSKATAAGLLLAIHHYLIRSRF